MSRTIDRTNAKRYAAIFQIGALACVLGAVAVGVIGLPGLATPAELVEVSERTSEPKAATPAKPGAAKASDDAYRHSMDPRSVADRLSLADNAPQAPLSDPDVVEDPTDEPSADPEPQTGMLMKRLRYLGYMSEGSDPLAFIRLDSVQHIVRPGQKIVADEDAEGGDVFIVTVTPQFVIARDREDGPAIKIPLQEKTGPSIAVVTTQPEIDVSRLDPSEITPRMIREVELTPEEIESLSGLLPHERALQERILKRQKLGLPAAFQNNLTKEALEKAQRINVFDRNRATDQRRLNEESSRERESDRD